MAIPPTAGEPEDRIRRCGKQLLLDDRHFGDFVSPEAAEVARLMIARGTLYNRGVSEQEHAFVEAFFA